MKQPSSTDFTIEVGGIGPFTFGRRTLRDELATQAEYSRLIDGVPTPTKWLSLVSGWVADLKVLMVKAPDGWVLDDLDPLDENSYMQLSKIWEALHEREVTFRKKPTVASPPEGSGAKPDN